MPPPRFPQAGGRPPGHPRAGPCWGLSPEGDPRPRPSSSMRTGEGAATRAGSPSDAGGEPTRTLLGSGLRNAPRPSALRLRSEGSDAGRRFLEQLVSAEVARRCRPKRPQPRDTRGAPRAQAGAGWTTDGGRDGWRGRRRGRAASRACGSRELDRPSAGHPRCSSLRFHSLPDEEGPSSCACPLAGGSPARPSSGSSPAVVWLLAGSVLDGDPRSVARVGLRRGLAGARRKPKLHNRHGFRRLLGGRSGRGPPRGLPRGPFRGRSPLRPMRLYKRRFPRRAAGQPGSRRPWLCSAAPATVDPAPPCRSWDRNDEDLKAFAAGRAPRTCAARLLGLRRLPAGKEFRRPP